MRSNRFTEPPIDPPEEDWPGLLCCPVCKELFREDDDEAVGTKYDAKMRFCYSVCRDKWEEYNTDDFDMDDTGATT